VFFTHSLPTYLKYKVIFHNVGYKKLFKGFMSFILICF
jgi:hypothetical protein